jgi:F-box protein 9
MPKRVGAMDAIMNITDTTAVEREQRGELNEALDLYRRAFRLDPNVDRAYHYRSTTDALESLTLAPIKPGTATQPKPAPISISATSTHSIRTLISAFPPASELAFLPEDERQPVPIARVPDELLLHTLKLLDIVSIEHFALVCRRARVLTVDPDLWRSVHRVELVPLIQLAFQGLCHLHLCPSADSKRCSSVRLHYPLRL